MQSSVPLCGTLFTSSNLAVPGRSRIAHRLHFLASNDVEPGSTVAVTGFFFRQAIERMPVNIVVVGRGASFTN
jgi:hypothetical protein